jgi:hypothetical protein
MSTAAWLALAGSLAVVLALWVYFSASRLDRLHARLDAAQSALDAQLVRRVAALRHAVDTAPAPPEQRDRVEAIAATALTATGPQRQRAENEVGRAVADLAADSADGGVVLSGAHRDELHESAVRVTIARRFYNDAVRDTRALRGRRMVRLLHLAGRREMPQFFDIDDTVPQELGRT